MNPLSADLAIVYARARGYKDSVLRDWVRNLERFTLTADPSQRDEALRRIDFIESHLIKSEVAA